MKCTQRMADGAPCQSPEGLVDTETGLCRSHDPRFAQERSERASLGGTAHAAKLQGEAFTADQLPPLTSIEDAKRSLDEIRIAALTRRISHNEASAATKAVEAWIKADAHERTKHVVDELTVELERHKTEIATLRRQLQAKDRRPLQVAR